jgi:anthranilate phosphoribosyltransferase
MARLGTEKSLIVSGDEGLDELSLAGGNEVAVVTGHTFTMERVEASAAGLPHAPIEAIRGDDARHNAAALKALLMGTPGPYRDAVLFNAAGALTVAALGGDWRERAAMAAEALDSGAAMALLGRWIDMAK